RPCQPCALFVRFAGHDCSDRAAERPAFHTIITEPVAHDERPEVRVAESERAENMRVLRDFLDRVTRVIDYDLLRCDENARRRFESIDIKVALRSFKL